MSDDLTKVKRYELKYTIPEESAREIRDYIQGICTLDRHADPETNGYIVNNLYFDTPDLRFYHDTKFRRLMRYKPRARYYGEKPVDFVWPEIKFRCSSVIWKKRYVLPIDQWFNLFDPVLDKRTDSIIKDEPEVFEDVIHLCGAQPVLHVRYFREPYVTTLERYGRVTFDRNLSCRPANGSASLYDENEDMLFYDDPVSTKDANSPVILEIKVETMVPNWVIMLIRKFGLQQRGFSKYCYGIDFCREIVNHRRPAFI
jgi:VTC domain